MTIDITTDFSKNLTVFTAKGELNYDSQMAVLRNFYNGTPTKNVLWDFRKISGSRITAEELEQIIEFVKRHDGKRVSGKTALVTSELIDYGLARMGSIFAEVEETSIKICAFKRYADAMKWLCD